MNDNEGPSYSVLILTKDEQLNVAECIRSIPTGVPVFVLDSLSTDRTTEIARSEGAQVFLREFDNYARQRNFGLNEIEYPTDWVLMVDADERMTAELHSEIVSQLKIATPDICLYRMRRKDMFFDTWLRHSSGYPTWFGRLARRGFVRVERDINEEFLTTGRVVLLSEHLIHYPFNKGIDYWFERHNTYSSMESARLLEETRMPIRWGGLFGKDPSEQRKWLKQIAYRLPLRPYLVFVYLYFFRFGFLDGEAGFAYCELRLTYEIMIDVKQMNLKATR